MSKCELKYITTKQQQYYANKINSSKHHINTTTQKHQILREKPSDVEVKKSWDSSEKYP